MPASTPAAEAAMSVSDSTVNPRMRMRHLLSFGARELHRLVQHPAVQPRTTLGISQSTLAKPTNGERIDTMFLNLHSRRQTCLVVVRRYGNARLDDRRTAVKLFGHEGDRRAMLRLLRPQKAPLRVQDRENWEPRRGG